MGMSIIETISAYESIKANISSNGKLPHSFSLEKKAAPNEISFIPGAMDGIGVFHAGVGKEKQAVEKITRLLKKYFKTGKGKYIANIEAILAESRTISLIDPILQSLRDDHKGIEPKRMINLSYNLLKTSSNVELVKIGIGLLGLLDLGRSDEASEIVSTLALYDDFTLYTVVAACNWTNGNTIVFRMAKGVDGWGKIHAVERLEPETDEIREWILRNGCSNGIMDNYLGLTCAVKGDLITVLRQESIDNELFDSIAIIIGALLGEGPAEGISEYEYAQEALTQFMRHAQKHVYSLEHLWRILNVREWAEDAEVDYTDEILAQCNEIIIRFEWKEKVISAAKRRSDSLEFFYACNAAVRLDIDISSELFNAVKTEPLKYYSYIPQLLKNPDMAASVINLCETVLPLDEMAEGMGDYLFSDKLNEEHLCLDFVLPGLEAYPLQGIKLIKTGLNSRVVSGRNMACRALSGWVKKLGKSLVDISPELYLEIERIYKIEVNEHTKETMKKLLDGGFEDPL